jgi:hypothetical protein
MRTFFRRDVADVEGKKPISFGPDQPADRPALAPMVATLGVPGSNILEAEDDIDPEEMYLDLGGGD